ncbi:MAG: DegT/DnrJ/EryC1/StrS family aminotransferase [bacterium]|nr:DegT/DnrJ/EryC1/StrS family aminotransferase [bacterium]
MKVDFFKHNVDAQDRRRVVEILKTPFLTTGAAVSEFEEKLAKDFGRGYHAVGLSSCTGALHLSLLALGIKRGDEVITTALSYVATAHAIEYIGAKPVFVDVDGETANIDISKIERAITRKTKAIIPVHLYGAMVDMKKIARIAKKHNLKVIEDSAHGFEISRDGYRPGRYSDATCFSFYATKSITSGEGGAFLTRDKDLADEVKLLRLHGQSKDASARHGKLYQHYDVPVLGWKYNMSNIQAALLLGQFGRYKKIWKAREKAALIYSKAFASEGVLFPVQERGVQHGHHLFTIWVEPKRRDSIMHELQKKGIGVGVNYRAIHLMSYYKKKYKFKVGSFPEAERIGASTISLPLYAKLTLKEQKYVIKNVVGISK